jgi:hypothetical protein
MPRFPLRGGPKAPLILRRRGVLDGTKTQRDRKRSSLHSTIAAHTTCVSRSMSRHPTTPARLGRDAMQLNESLPAGGATCSRRTHVIMRYDDHYLPPPLQPPSSLSTQPRRRPTPGGRSPRRACHPGSVLRTSCSYSTHAE